MRAEEDQGKIESILALLFPVTSSSTFSKPNIEYRVSTTFAGWTERQKLFVRPLDVGKMLHFNAQSALNSTFHITTSAPRSAIINSKHTCLKYSCRDASKDTTRPITTISTSQVGCQYSFVI